MIIYQELLAPNDRAVFATSNFIRSEGLPISIWGSRRKSEKADIIKYFGGSEVLRECCSVVLDVSWMYKNAADDKVFDALRTLTNFQNLTVKVIRRFGAIQEDCHTIRPMRSCDRAWRPRWALRSSIKTTRSFTWISIHTTMCSWNDLTYSRS